MRTTNKLATEATLLTSRSYIVNTFEIGSKRGHTIVTLPAVTLPLEKLRELVECLAAQLR